MVASPLTIMATKFCSLAKNNVSNLAAKTGALNEEILTPAQPSLLWAAFRLHLYLERKQRHEDNDLASPRSLSKPREFRVFQADKNQ